TNFNASFAHKRFKPFLLPVYKINFRLLFYQEILFCQYFVAFSFISYYNESRKNERGLFMRKKFKTLCKYLTALITIGVILCIARDQIKALFEKSKELTGKEEEPEDEDFDDDDIFEDDDIFPEPSEDDRDYVSIHITGDADDDASSTEEKEEKSEE